MQWDVGKWIGKRWSDRTCRNATTIRICFKGESNSSVLGEAESKVENIKNGIIKGSDEFPGLGNGSFQERK